MLLSGDDIARLELINPLPEVMDFASVNLTIGEIVTKVKNKKADSVLLPPQGMVLVVSEEIFDLRNRKVIGITTIKNSLSIKGVWALNIGIVDTNWFGPISSIIINFSKEDVELSKGMEFLRMTFQTISELNEDQIALIGGEREMLDDSAIIKRKKEYTKDRKEQFWIRMDNEFLMLGLLGDKIAKQVKSKIIKEATLMLGLISVVAIIITIAFFIVDHYTDDEMELRHNNQLLKVENEALNLRLENLTGRLDALESKPKINYTIPSDSSTLKK